MTPLANPIPPVRDVPERYRAVPATLRRTDDDDLHCTFAFDVHADRLLLAGPADLRRFEVVALQLTPTGSPPVHVEGTVVEDTPQGHKVVALAAERPRLAPRS